MTAILARHSGARCSICKDIIRKGDPIVCIDDRWLHEECEPAPGAWEEAFVSRVPTQTPEPVRELLKILLAHGTIGERLFKEEYDPFLLPRALSEALFGYLAAEGHLWSLMHDLASEHAIRKEA